MIITARYLCPTPSCRGGEIPIEITITDGLPGRQDHLICTACNVGVLNRIQDFVVGLHFQANREHVTLIQKTHPEWQAGKLNGPGGKLEYGETPQEAQSREHAEETGAKIPPAAWHLFATLRLKGGARVYFLSAFRNANVRTVTDEKVSLYNVGIASDPGDALIPNLKFLIPMALHGGEGHADLDEGLS